jgi:DNA-binding PadR family transcriptional regulator
MSHRRERHAMKPLRYHVLLALAQGALHGAEIRRRVEEDSAAAITLYPAQLYGTLDELAADGWIREVEPDEVRADQTRWRFYALTPAGKRALEVETGRLQRVLGRARSALADMNRAR